MTGKTVICTIHQPSFEVFDMFTEVLLLERGGRIIYLGEKGIQIQLDLGAKGVNIVDYFESLQDTPVCNDTNPASWALDITGAGVYGGLKNFNQHYIKSDLFE